MLTDMIVEEEFEIKEEEPWFDHQDLEHDLHLAAELGKTLLDRNRELEEGLKQMYGTNQEQLQEIEYLSKQVDLLRSVNDQHAKVYEQLDNMARDLEQSNHRLVMDNRAAQNKIQGLTDTIEGLQTQVDELQKQVVGLSVSTAEMAELQRPGSSRSLGSGKVRGSGSQHSHSVSDDDDEDLCRAEDDPEDEAEYEALVSSVQALQAQLASERLRREVAEREVDALARECGELDARLSQLEGCRARLAEAETEVAELRELWRADGARNAAASRFLPDALLLLPTASSERGGGCWRGGRGSLKRCSSERQLRVSEEEDDGGDDDGGEREGVDGVGVSVGCCRHERACLGRSEVVKQRGISLLNEVDAQYSALQVKYDALLRRCEGGPQVQSNKAVQTPASTAASSTTTTTTTTAATTMDLDTSAVASTHSVAVGVEEDAQLPEYKVLFHEIFKCIQRSKADIMQNRDKPRHVE
ncbi:cerebellar degeneration-related protein 2-like [Alosa pseudoharengus]|uniref:cerebellar degeneration-related protein 2-like n=1 Tax=Alosa pseudoharengus TaxID=34774 RepID=UPI003F8B9A2A